jgi:hypothetical protein
MERKEKLAEFARMLRVIAEEFKELAAQVEKDEEDFEFTQSTLCLEAQAVVWNYIEENSNV